MATSSIRYGKRNVFVNDSQLGDWIKAMTETFDDLNAQNIDIEWLLLECDQWCEIYENFPPGLKDIELDEVLFDDNRKEIFIDLLKKVKRKVGNKDYNLEVAKDISSKLLFNLFEINQNDK